MAVNPVEDFVLIYYQNTWGTHTMTRPTRDWNGTPWVTSAGSYTNWNDDEKPADAMIVALIDTFLPLFKPETSFTSYVIHHVVTSGEPAIPVYARNLTGKVGTSIDTSQ